MKSYWILPKEECAQTHLYEFTKTFFTYEPMRLNISASTRYKLYVNEQYVCEGPCQGSQYERYYEQIDVTKYLLPTENQIKVYVLHTQEDIFTTVFTTNKPMLWMKAYNDKHTILVSDDSWHISLINGIEYYQGDMVMFSACFYEKYHKEIQKKTLTTILGEEVWENSDSCSICGQLNLLPLTKSMLPQMSRPDFSVIPVVKKKKSMLIFDVGSYTTAKIRIRVSGQENDILYLKYSECYVKSVDGWNFYKGFRDDDSGVLVGPSDQIVLSETTKTVEFWWYRAFRYLSVSCSVMEKLKLEVLMSPSHYPFSIDGTFECSDTNYNQMWKISINTLLCCSHEIFLDCPMFEQQQYCMDTFLESMYSMQISKDTHLICKAISDLAQSQQPNGLLCANYPSRHVQIIPGFSIYFILLVDEFYKYSGDLKILKHYYGVISKILDAMEGLLDDTYGLIQSKYWSFIDWTDCWKHGVPNYGNDDFVTVNSMLYSMGLLCGEHIADALGRKGSAIDYKLRRNHLNAQIRKHCFNEESHYYNDTVYTKERSQHTAIWAILAEIETEDCAVHLAQQMMSSEVTKCSFSMSFFLFRALEKTNQYKKAFSLFSGFQKMMDFHCTTWCENPNHPRSECHGWSAVPLYEFTTMILGVKNIRNGYKEVEISPNCGTLTFAKGKIPTPFGEICIEWEKTDQGILLFYDAPENVKIVIPHAKKIDCQRYVLEQK